jgi:uncharacterized membrane protein
MGDSSNQETQSRSLAKSISWRITGSIDTFIISAIVTGKFTVAGSIATTELFTKVLLYYYHERIWARIPLGNRTIANRGSGPDPGSDSSGVAAAVTSEMD